MDKVRRPATNFCPTLLLISQITQAPLSIRVNSPLELVQQFFVKLGARYVVVTDSNGYCELFPLPFRWTIIKSVIPERSARRGRH